MLDTENFKGDATRVIVEGFLLLIPMHFMGVAKTPMTFMGVLKNTGKAAASLYLVEELAMPAIKGVGGANVAFGTINYV